MFRAAAAGGQEALGFSARPKFQVSLATIEPSIEMRVLRFEGRII
jgi:hypothetical protein